MSGNGAPLDLLVVDASADRHEIYGKLLTGLAGRVVTTCRGEEARQLLESNKYGAMLVHFDGAGGSVRADLTDLVSSAAHSSASPVIIIADAEQTVGGGVVEYIPTQFVSELLAPRVSCVLELWRLRAERASDQARMTALEAQVSELAATVAEEKKAAAALARRVAEQAHRSKNLLAILQSVTLRTVSDGRTIADARSALMGRFKSLARSHHLVLAAEGGGVEIAEAVDAELADVAHRISISGPPVRLTSSVAQTFMLALHELAMNATQYGALRSDAGGVSLGWTFFEYGADRYLEVLWREYGGGPLQPPTQQGFGLALVSSFGGSREDAPSVSFDPEGIVCRMRLAQDAIVGG